MNFDAIIDQAVAFSSNGIGATIKDVFAVLYTIFFPSNSEAAFPIEIPA
ncbi:hypothetical protein QP027_10830 [Corynebacterium breve]|uniref:Uncharacterized protein n=1 Tax=Corynebacterium breve TaxID=3049799 RepID=A0ABY8VD26_9CORY|nr:hypothetical protein [Corynebacterium breve]WIM67571.1 hypothetical protein QP027_10830 [Corynebacterium breve]